MLPAILRGALEGQPLSRSRLPAGVRARLPSPLAPVSPVPPSRVSGPPPTGPIRSGATTAQAPERTAAQKQSGRLRSILGQPSLVSRKSATPRCRYFRPCSRKA